MRRSSVLTIMLLLAGMAVTEAATLDRVRQSGVFRIGYRADAKPYSYRNAQGQPAGYIVDLCDEVAAAFSPRVRTQYILVSADQRFQAVRDRRDGYRKALTGHALDEPEGFYLPGVWSEGWGREAVAQLFRASREPPDAIFCGSDQIARGVTDALRERGIVVPNQVSIVGFDNWDIMAEASRPPLTSVDMNLKELGREAGRRLIDLIAGKEFRGVRRIPCTLVTRESCGARSRADNPTGGI